MPRNGLRALLAGALSIVACFGLSGCFVFNSFKWSPNVVKPGKPSSAVVGVIPLRGGSSQNKDYPFVLVGFNDPTQLALGKKHTFDTKGDFGGPYKMFADQALAGAAVDTASCEFGGEHLNQQLGVSWLAVRTDVKVNDKDKKKPAIAKAEVRTIGANVTPSQEAVIVINGDWVDDGDHVVQPNEVGCSGGTIAFLPIRD